MLKTGLILDKIPLGIIILNEENKIISVNGWGEKYIEASNNYLMEVIHDLAKSTLDTNLSIEKTIKIYDPQGLLLWRIKSEFIKYSPPQIMVIIQDDTVNFQLEQTVLKAEELAVAGSLAIGSLIEIRNPLTSAWGFCQLIKDNATIKKDYVDMIFTELGQIQDIVVNTALTGESNRTDDISNRIWATVGSKIDAYKIIVVSDADDNLDFKVSAEQTNTIISVIESLDIWAEEMVFLLSCETNAASRRFNLSIRSINEYEPDILKSGSLVETINYIEMNNCINMRIIDNRIINIEFDLPNVYSDVGMK